MCGFLNSLNFTFVGIIIYFHCVNNSIMSIGKLFTEGHQFFQTDPYYTCSLEQSPHHFIYDLFNVVALTEIKGYAMIQVPDYSRELISVTRFGEISPLWQKIKYFAVYLRVG